MWKYVLNKMIKQKEATFFIVMIILSFAVSSAAPYLNGKFIDLLTVSKDIHLIVQFALIIVGVGVVGALISYCSNLTTVKVLTKTTMASIYEGMDNLLETDLVIAEKLDFSYITQRLFQDANVITSFVLSNFLSIFLNGILIVGVLYCFFVIDPLLCLIVVVVLIPYIVLFLALKRPLFDSSEKKKEADSRLFGSIHSIVEQVFSIQLNSRFSGAKKEAQASFTNCFPFILKAGRLSYLFSSIDSIIQTVFQSVLFIFAGIQIAVGNMTVGEFVMINSYFALLLRAVKYYTAIYKQYQDSLASYKRMRAILAYPKILNGEIEIDAINTIEVQNLNYGFSDQKHMVFSNANCVFKKGESYSIIGENGEGKSTLFKILTSLYGYGKYVLFDGLLSAEIDLKSARKRLFSCVPQKLYAPQINVKDFLVKTMNVTVDELNLMLENSEELNGYAQFLKNILGHRCDTLSGGELRKLYVWVASQKKADVLLLDEPTTDLDAQSQAELIDFIKQNRSAQLIIAIKILKPSGSHCTAVTNGLLANPATIQQLASAGLDGIQFSLDGLRDSHERLRNKVGIFPKVIDAMKYVLNETGLRLSIAFTPTSFNVKDFLGVYDLLVDLYEKSNRTTGSDYIDFRLQPLMLLGRAKDNPNIVPTDAQYRWLVQNINEVNLTGKCHPCIDVKWGDPIDHLVRFRDTNYFMDQVSVHANGDIVVSAYLPLVVGNVRKRSLSDYWNAGLKTIWATNVVQYLTARMQSVRDMENITTLISDINMDGCLNLDLMENDFNDLNLIKGVILEEWM